MKVLNFNVYFPIQIWKKKNENIYRLQPPNFKSSQGTFTFHPHFCDSIKNKISKKEYKQLIHEFELIDQIWVFNPRYGYSLTRGFVYLYILYAKKYPYHSEQIFSPTVVPIDISFVNYYDGLILISYQYSIPNTSLLCLVRNNERKITDIVLLDDKTSTPINFLPTLENKDIPFYKLQYPDNYIFIYVFKEKPIENFWKANGENICIPSNNHHHFPTLLDCMYNNVDKLAIRNVYTQTNNAPLATLLEPSPSPTINFSLPIILFSILCITIIVFISILFLD